MSTRKIIVGLCICLFVIVFADRTLSQTRRGERTRRTINTNPLGARRRISRQQTMHRRRMRQLDRRIQEEQARVEELKRSGFAKSLDEFRKQELGVTEQQWKVLKPKIERITDIFNRGNAYMRPRYYKRSSSSYSYSGGSVGGSIGSTDGNVNVVEKWETSERDDNQPVTKSEEGWEWERSFKDKAPGKLTECERVCEELLGLLEDENSTREEIERKVEALRKTRRKTNEQMTKARQELEKGLNLRQEAVLVLMRYLY
jgi:hypothetical protein